MTIATAGKNLSAALNSIYDEREAANIASLVMEKITGFSKSERSIYKQNELDEIQQNKLEFFTRELLQHKPVQYVLNEAWFAGMLFYVDENVLIPRPETEELVETVKENIDQLNERNLSILDIGTGSGCIAVALKKKLPQTSVFAMDISDNALKIAAKNATSNNTNIEFIKADILNFHHHEPFPQFDIIVSNPPYIMQSESGTMLPNVLLYEPKEALFVADDDALIFYKAIIDFALIHLNPSGGKLFFEINEMMGEQVAALLKAKGFSSINIKKDMQEKNRVVSAYLG